MSYVIRTRGGSYLQLWYSGGLDTPNLERVDLVAKSAASSWRTHAQAKRELAAAQKWLDDATIEVR